MQTTTDSVPTRRESTEPATGWSRSFTNIRREHGFEPLSVEGRLPEALNGTLYRNGPGLVSLFDSSYRHWFDGDGVISALRLERGLARGAVRLMQTRGLTEERDRGKRWFGSFGTAPPRPFNAYRLVRTMLGKGKNPANTSVLDWNGRLFGLCEAGRPFEIDPADLRSIGETDFGVIERGFSAHPHRLARSGFLYNIGVQIGRPHQLDLFELRTDGVARQIAAVPLAHGTMIHDFALTERHAVVFLAPLRLELLPTLFGRASFKDNLRWDADAPTEVLVIPLDAPEKMVRFDVESFWVWHVANAFERGGEIVIDLVRYPDYPSSAAWIDRVPSGRVEREAHGRLGRTVIDPAKKTLRHEVFTEQTGEFPRVAPWCDGAAHRLVFWCENSSPAQARTGPPDTVARFDTERGDSERFTFASHLWPSEGVFVPRPNADDEGDGWLITQVYDADAHRSGWSVFDARGLADGPLAWAWLDHHLPLGFHGTFRDA